MTLAVPRFDFASYCKSGVVLHCSQAGLCSVHLCSRLNGVFSSRPSSPSSLYPSGVYESSLRESVASVSLTEGWEGALTGPRGVLLKPTFPQNWPWAGPQVLGWVPGTGPCLYPGWLLLLLILFIMAEYQAFSLNIMNVIYHHNVVTCQLDWNDL